MTSIYQNFQKRTTFISSMPTPIKKQALPVSQSQNSTDQATGFHLRRRLSSLSLKIQPSPDQINSTTSWVLRRSKSVSSMGENAGSSIRKWWEWGWGWILSKKPVFAKDLEMNEHETASLGFHNKGSWRHVFYKVRSEFRKLVGSDQNVGLPQTFRYDSVAYAQNFDDGRSTFRG